MKRSTKRALRQCWGYLLLVLVLYAWLNAISPWFIMIASGFVVLYCLFQAPVWCCAETRQQEFCRNNAYGILMGCHLKQHKWQKFRMSVDHHLWAKLGRRVLAGFGGQAASFSSFAALTSATVATITLILK